MATNPTVEDALAAVRQAVTNHGAAVAGAKQSALEALTPAPEPAPAEQKGKQP